MKKMKKNVMPRMSGAQLRALEKFGMLKDCVSYELVFTGRAGRGKVALAVWALNYTRDRRDVAVFYRQLHAGPWVLASSSPAREHFALGALADALDSARRFVSLMSAGYARALGFSWGARAKAQWRTR